MAGAGYSTPARAEPSNADRTLAAALFREGKSLMDKSDFAAACAKLEESQRLDPGGGTLLNVAVCHEKQGKIATAWGEFIEALGLARRDKRQSRIELAEEHIAKLEPALPKLTIVVPPESDESSLEVTRDGAAVGRAAWGMPFPVDPGEHRIRAAAANKVPFSVALKVAGTVPPPALTVRVPPLDPEVPPVEPSPARAPASAPAAPPPERPALPGGAAGAVSPPRAPGSGPVSDSRKVVGSSTSAVLGWGAVGLGGVGIVAGTALTVLALNKKSESHDRCPRDPCDAEAVRLSQDAGRFADFATVGYGAGFVALAAGIVLLLADGSRAPRTGTTSATTWVLYPQARGGGASMGLRGLF